MAIKTLNEVTREVLNEVTQAALTKFRNSVWPIYGADEGGIPDHIGTAILVHLPEGHFLVTAAHVIDHNVETSLYLGADHRTILQFDAIATVPPNGNRSEDHADFAAAQLDTDLIAKLPGAKFVTETDICQSQVPSDGRIFVCLGYPNSKNKVKPRDGTKISPSLLPYASIGRPASQLPTIAAEELHVLVDYNAKYVRDDMGRKVSATDMHGCSGGAIIDAGRFSVDALSNPPELKLAALFIEGHAKQKVILGTRLMAILTAIRHRQRDGDGATII